jgi:Ca2+/H+ antiporter, TMEM165/GDT1 family
MEVFLISTIVVGLAEIGDKTQILSMLLAARLRCSLPIISGILVATVANHVCAGIAGVLFGSLLTGVRMRWILGISFLGVALWALIPDKAAPEERAVSRTGAFAATVCAFFLAEIGDKTQLATMGLAARFEDFYFVVSGTTLGMMLANIPAVLIGRRVADRVPLKAIRVVAAAAFATLGIITLAGIAGEQPLGLDLP